ncbi:TIGR02270 family protein [Granulosicoccus antarcticus]|uniref:TIGR02270 family protein n=1 Tax=Granulosicoccus antarcticus IMCC3135 TaxID=1192854 RepID=A0A2Z2P7Z4_9GAMM|nr:TIGR02270 family protein [Granulosicoccus antarcticus]ASJ76797.1 hypothetical protein IMCC3135_33780 [Granulosicoccus antarcticus IMCC3135]
MPHIIETVVYQHAENACALWWQWHLALDQPHYTLGDLTGIEKRINANMNGLRIAGKNALIQVQELADANDEGAIFVSALLAIQRGDISGFLTLAETDCVKPGGLAELSTALAWADHDQSQRIILQLLNSDRAEWLILGLQACVAHARNPGQHLYQCTRHSDSRVRATAFQAAANLGDKNILRTLPVSTPGGPDEQFELARAFTFLGRYKEGQLMLEQLALGSSHVAPLATRLFLLSASSAISRDLLRTLNDRPERARDVVRGFGLLGEPTSMEWLIDQCHSPMLGRLAGESITLITGVDLINNDLELADGPETAINALSDEPDDKRVKLDEDDNLPWPDAPRISHWWENLSAQPINDKQYLCGHLRTSKSYQLMLRIGKQRQRTIAADIMALTNPGAPYCNTHLPTWRQPGLTPGGPD